MKGKGMSKIELEEKLERKGVKPTSNRILVLKALEKTRHPVSLSDLEEILFTMDKSSIFRVMCLFHEHDVVDSFEDGRGIVNYELCGSEGKCDHSDAHLHFYCKNCHLSYCLRDIKPSDVNLPEGFVAESYSLVVNGLCSECSKGKDPQS